MCVRAKTIAKLTFELDSKRFYICAAEHPIMAIVWLTQTDFAGYIDVISDNVATDGTHTHKISICLI